MFKDDFNINQINLGKVVKTVRASIKKSIFYLGANIPYDYSESLVKVYSSGLQKYLDKNGKRIKEVVELDAKIRYCDDILDDQLSKIRPKPIKKMKEIINLFQVEVPMASEVAQLFLLEVDIVNKSFSEQLLKEKILNIINIRPCDFFVLAKVIIKNFGTSVSEQDFKYSWDFFVEFQRIRDLMDDIMSVEEDLLKKDYNSVIIAKKNKISYHFFEDIIFEKISNLKFIISKIQKHPYKDVFIESIDFWEKQYSVLFKKLLVDYYVDLDEFKKSYFIIKQL
ncbi:MAG: hypothetical protein AAB653_00975 [Patescibacteria group bacterium]